MTSEEFFQTHPAFTHEEYAQSRGAGSPRTVDSLLRKHVQGGRIARVRLVLAAQGPGSGVRTQPPRPHGTPSNTHA